MPQLTFLNSSARGTALAVTAVPLVGQQVVGTHIYSLAGLRAAITAGTVNNTILAGPGNQNYLGKATFTLTEARRVVVSVDQAMAFEPLQNDGIGGQSAIVMRVNNAWTLGALDFGTMSNMQASHQAAISVLLATGAQTLDFYLVAVAEQAARVIVQGHATASGAVFGVGYLSR